MMANTKAKQHGFSLLEVVVTVAIFAMLFGVLMAGWFQSLNAQARLSETAQVVQQQQQLTASLRQLLAEAMSPAANRGLVFAGSAQGFAVESMASLAPGLGAAALPVTLKFEKRGELSTLKLEHPGQNSVVFPWRFRQARLRYLDARHAGYETWPPEAGTGGEAVAVALPSLVQLTLQLEGQAAATTLLIAPRASPTPLPEAGSPFSGLGK
jgi:prepilin-type N-terminal cleavage/methylation domain-containing protein